MTREEIIQENARLQIICTILRRETDNPHVQLKIDELKAKLGQELIKLDVKAHEALPAARKARRELKL